MNKSKLLQNNMEYHDLTHPQKRIWYIEKIHPDTSMHNIGGVVRIKGIVDFNILEESINIFIKKNQGVRLQLIENDGDVKQYIKKFKNHKLDFFDFSCYEESEKHFNIWIDKEIGKSFSLYKNELFYFALFKISDAECGYFVKFHHIIADGWSINIMTEEICNIYMKLLNKEILDEKYNTSYIEYIQREQEYLKSKRFTKNKEFWNNEFITLPQSPLSNSANGIEGNRRSFDLDINMSKEIKEFAYKHKCSLNTFFISIFLIYLYKITQHNDLVIGTPVLNRSGKKERSIFGMFTSTMPFRFNIDDKSTLLNIISDVNYKLKKCYFNQKYPYDLLIQDLNLKKRGYGDLFNICVNYYNTSLDTQLNGLPIENIELYNGKQNYSLQLIIREWSDLGNIMLDFDYKHGDYTKAQIENMYYQIIHIIRNSILNPGEKISGLSIIPEAEKMKLLYTFNSTKSNYPMDKTIYKLFEEQVEKTPDKTAISFNDTRLTYRELNEKSNQLARVLIQRGIERESVIGLYTKHSIETVVGILGILKAGAAYLPLDPNYPVERINYILEDCGVDILLTNYPFSNDIDFKGEVIDIKYSPIYSGDKTNLNRPSKPQDLAYVIYTSGSTGMPKGVMVEHQGLVNYICWAVKMYVGDKEVFPLYSSLAFDLTITSIFTPLISGNEIIVYRDDGDEYVLYRIMKDNKATVIKLTPSHLSLLKDMDNTRSSVKRFIVGGEDLKVSLAGSIYKSFNGDIEIFNEYGPTEAVVGCMIHGYDFEKDNDKSVPIGIPADNVQIYILDKNLNPLPKNAVGEIYISGHGVARGYLNKPKFTNGKFIDNPFINGKRMYRTGDLARFSSDGEIQYIGRIDNQVKIRGYRIELGEIEKYIVIHEGIKDAVVIVNEDNELGKYLIAYIVQKTEISIDKLKDYLSRYLPDYMVPLYFIKLDEIPLTSNGKVNRESLPQPQSEIVEKQNYISYGNISEEKLVNIICEILKIKEVSLKHNFYHLGGDSIKAIQISSKLNQIGLKLRVKDILDHPIIEDMALYIEIQDTDISQELCRGSIKPTPIVAWFLSQNFVKPEHYNQSILLKIKEDIDVRSLETMLNKLIKHHDSLRINYSLETEVLYYNNDYLSKHYNVKEYDLSGFSTCEQSNKMQSIGGQIKSSFDLENSILIKACLFNLGENGKRLLLTAHHLVIDGVSWRIILQDIDTMLKQIARGEDIQLPLKTHSFQKWAEMLKYYSENEAYGELEYWKSAVEWGFKFPTDYDLDETSFRYSSSIDIEISEDITEKLMLGANKAFNTDTRDLLITALLKTISQFSRSKDIVIELEGHGREDILKEIDITSTVGWFTSLYPFKINIQDKDLSEDIKHVKEELRKIPNNGIGFGILKYLSGFFTKEEKTYIRFNYLGDFSGNLDKEIIEILNQQSGDDSCRLNHLTCLLEINCYVIDKKLNVILKYCQDEFQEENINSFMNTFKDYIEGIIIYCCRKKTVDFTSSDFDTIDLSQDELDSIFA